MILHVAWHVKLAHIVSSIKYAGWEYSVEATLGGYGPVEKAYHLCRRRRLVRMRHLVQPSKAKVDSEEKVPYCFAFTSFLYFSIYMHLYSSEILIDILLFLALCRKH